ncbi:MAG: hypothetical protein ACD_60C00126G0002 [uncultured bacterium]|nr:MAG: hypothetical protein ACD_60C00126G0002 [uncultured bacterium]
MAKRNKFSLGDTVKNVIMLVPNIIGIVSDLAALVRLETQLAGKTIVTVLILSIMYAFLMISIWFCLLAMLFIYLVTSLQWSLMMSLLLLLGLNTLCLMIIGFIIVRIKRNLLFPATLSECRSLRETFEEEL